MQMNDNDVDGRSIRQDGDCPIREAWMVQAISACQLLMCEVGSAAPGVTARVRRISKTIPAPVNKLEELLLHGMLFEVLLSVHRGASLDAHTSDAVERTLTEIGVKVSLRNLAAEAAPYIERHMTDPLDVKEVARHVGCAETTLRRLFRKEFDVSMRDYLTRLRVRQSLRAGASYSCIGDLARSVGYESEKNFYRAVRDVTGTTPTALRRLSPAALAQLVESIVPKGRSANSMPSVEALSAAMKISGIPAA